VCNFGIAVNRNYKDKDGNKQEEVTFVDCAAFNRVGTVVQEYTKQGDALHIEGRLTLDQWQNQQGENRQKLKIIVETVRFVGGKDGENQQQSQTQQQGGGQQGAPQDSDDVPF